MRDSAVPNVISYIMTTLKFTLTFLLITLYSCGQQPAKHTVNPEATKLNKQIIPLVNYIDNADSCKRALSFLDSATTIDSTCFLCYYNKLMFLNSLKQYDKAISTVNRLLRLKPAANDLYMTGGFYYKKAGDTSSANHYFRQALSICNAVLDTMNTGNENYLTLTLNKALDMIMLGDQTKGNEILRQVYDQQTDSAYKDYISSFMNKSEDELLNFTPDKYIQ